MGDKVYMSCRSRSLSLKLVMMTQGQRNLLLNNLIAFERVWTAYHTKSELISGGYFQLTYGTLA